MTAEMVRHGEGAAVGDWPADVALALGTNLRVLISGETGVGKSRLARLLHDGGPRRAQPFVTVTCSGISDVVLAAELFGHGPHGAHGPRSRGAYERADGGTLVLGPYVAASDALIVAIDSRPLGHLGRFSPYALRSCFTSSSSVIVAMFPLTSPSRRRRH